MDAERQTKERLIHEARVRIEQYEARLIQMKQESDLFKQTAEEHRAEVERLRSASAATQQQGQAAQELEQRIQEKEQKFQKMKAIYDGLREEHIKVQPLGKAYNLCNVAFQILKEIGELRSKTDNFETERMQKEEEIRQLARRVEEAERDKLVEHEKAQTSANSVDEFQSQLARSQIEIENMTKAIDDLKQEFEGEKAALAHQHGAEMTKVKDDYFGMRVVCIHGICLCVSASVCAACCEVVEQCQEDLQNATSVTYPQRTRPCPTFVLLSKI